jgi:integrase
MAEPLTPARLRNLKPTERIDLPDGACPGLVLRASPDRPWKWTLRLHLEGKRFTRISLGDYSETQGIRWAREQARVLRQQVRHEGRDPVREKRQRAKTDGLTLEALAVQWQAEHLSKKTDGYAREAVRALRNAFAEEWTEPAAALNPDAIQAGLAKLMDAKRRRRGADSGGHAMAGRTCAYGSALYEWARARRLVPSNPFEHVPTEDYRTPSRDRVLTDAELVAVWAAAAEMDNTFGRLVHLLVLTACRREEVAGMTWAELSTDRATWTIPPARAKNGVAHLVPLSDVARAVLPPRPDDAGNDALVLPGQRGTPFSGWSKSKAELDAKSGVTGWRLHDIRRTVATGLQRLGVRLEVTEAILGHVSGSRAGIVGIYQRHEWADEKRVALNAWADHVSGLLRAGADPGIG